MKGIDIVISTIDYKVLELQKPLIDAAKRAAVKRFVPSDFGTACKKGVRELFDEVSAICAESRIYSFDLNILLINRNLRYMIISKLARSVTRISILESCKSFCLLRQPHLRIFV